MKNCLTGLLYGPVKVNGFSRGCLIPAGKIWPEVRQVIAFRPQVVINHVKDDGHAVFMARIDKPLKAIRPAIRMLHGIKINPVVAPSFSRRGIAPPA